jgi:N-acetylglucosaminyldiphosphoundecaprenol N-acetyl-beta-D-mannosaminyltransferase
MPDRVELLGGAVDLVNQDGVMDFIADAVATGRKAIIGNQNLHSLYLCRKDPRMSAFFAAADLIEIDSMPLLFWGRVLGLDLSRAHRCTYLDWRDAFWRLASKRKWRVFCLGAAADANREAIVRLQREWPGVVLAGHDGYFDHSAGSRVNAAVVERINRFRPDILLVAMGMPLQEIWISENHDAIVSGVMLSVGAAFDYEAGAQRAAPRIYGDLGFEWLYRLAHEPRRLFYRYMIEPWSLVGLAARDLRQGPVGRRTVRPRTTRLVLEEHPIDIGDLETLSAPDDLRSAA